MGYIEGIDFAPFGYDWRKSNQFTATLLADFLREQSKRGQRRFKIVAHSMGGLVVRLLLLDPKNKDITSQIDTFVQVGSPVKGAPRALTTLKQRPQFGRICDLIFKAADHISPESYHHLLEALSTFPSLYELLPHATEKVVLTNAGDQWTALDRRLWPRRDEVAQSELDMLHTKVRSWHGPNMVCIYSADVNTDVLYSIDDTLSRFNAIARAKGDGTVTVASAAEGADAPQCIALAHEIDHQSLPNHWAALQTITQALNDSLPTDYFPRTDDQHRPVGGRAGRVSHDYVARYNASYGCASRSSSSLD